MFFFFQIINLISPDDQSSQMQSTNSICEEILCLCDYSHPPLVSALITYRAPLAGLLTAAAVTYMYWCNLLLIF